MAISLLDDWVPENRTPLGHHSYFRIGTTPKMLGLGSGWLRLLNGATWFEELDEISKNRLPVFRFHPSNYVPHVDEIVRAMEFSSEWFLGIVDV